MKNYAIDDPFSVKSGDKFLIKSRQWYEKNKDSLGFVDLGKPPIFVPGMADYCGKIVTAHIISDDFFTIKEDPNNFLWSLEMMVKKENELQYRRPRPSEINNKIKNENRNT